jgi:hypothetical protein
MAPPMDVLLPGRQIKLSFEASITHSGDQLEIDGSL